MLPWIGSDELLDALPVVDAADALAAALRADEPLAAAPQRTVVPAGAGQLLAMPAGGASGAGAKLVTIAPENPARGLPLVHGVYVLFSPGELRPVAVFDGAALTALRTPAVSVVATRALARVDARHLVVFGAGVQARAHVDAMRAIRPLERVTVVSPGASAGVLVDALRAEGVDAVRGEPGAVAAADLVCACTTAAAPVFDGALLAPGAHVNAVGSYQLHTRELDATCLARALVVLEDRDAVLAEAGDLQIPIAARRYAESAIAGDLADVARGTVTRADADQITVFKSVGLAWEDLVVAQAAAARLALTGAT